MVFDHFPARIFEERSENMSWCLRGQNRRIGDQNRRYYVTEKIQKVWIKRKWLFAGPDLLSSGAKKLRMVFPHISVLSKPPQLQYGAKKWFWSPVVPGIFYRNPLGFVFCQCLDSSGLSPLSKGTMALSFRPARCETKSHSTPPHCVGASREGLRHVPTACRTSLSYTGANAPNWALVSEPGF